VDGLEIREAGESVHAVLFLLSPQDRPGQHLRLLGHLATHVDDPGFVERWLQARDAHEIRQNLMREERSLSLRLERDGPLADWIGLRVRDLVLPRDSLVVLIRRGAHGLIPRGETELHEGDRLTVIGGAAAIRQLDAKYGRG
jgi:hypothetical protein